ncbi:hypothetical protein Taro_034675 [Colocasia esculenta]|uniref:Methyl-CpG-binding domain-containing protein 9 n=1 Tax=Colocasia esculenta TaxID=4460 RepID=A0A843W1I5_COLES|nr:hypothetical protein [Colocasia esculenta]
MTPPPVGSRSSLNTQPLPVSILPSRPRSSSRLLPGVPVPFHLLPHRSPSPVLPPLELPVQSAPAQGSPSYASSPSWNSCPLPKTLRPRRRNAIAPSGRTPRPVAPLMDPGEQAAACPTSAAFRRHPQGEDRPIHLSIDLNEIPSPSSDTPASTPTAGPAPAAHTPEVVALGAYDVVLRYHASPTVPHEPPADFPGEAGVGRAFACGLCGLAETQGDTVVCDRCETGFHLGCARIRNRHALVHDDWVCGECKRQRYNSRRWPLGTVSAAPLRRGFRLLDINAPPPSDGDDSPLTLKMFPMDRDSGGGFSGQVSHPVFGYMGRGYDVGKNFRTSLDNVRPSLGSAAFQGLISKKNVDNTFKNSSIRMLSPSDSVTMRQSARVQAEMLLQSLKDFVIERQGFLGEGWHVEFRQCFNQHDTYTVYCSPDGNSFNSMVDVAHYLGLTSKTAVMDVDERSEVSGSFQKSFPQHRRIKDLARLSRANCASETQGSVRNGHSGDSSDDEIIETWQCSVGSDARATKSFPDEKNQLFHQWNIGLPVQFGDFFITFLGEIDPRPAYHDADHIWPIGYRCSWHDRITGSLFECEVSDGGDAGPVFKVKRHPCSMFPIPSARIVLTQSRLQKNIPLAEGSEVLHDFGNDDSAYIQMLLYDPNPSGQDFMSCISNGSYERFDGSLLPGGIQKTNNSESYLNCFAEKSSGKSYKNLALRDDIGEFCVQGRSSSSVWRMVSQTLSDSCLEAYKRSGNLQFCCTHAIDDRASLMPDIEDVNKCKNISSLARFCAISGPFDIPKVINCKNQLESSLKILTKWLEEDRFGLDMDFVQEIIEQLPGAPLCKQYKFLTERSYYPTSVTVGSGFLSAKGQNMEQHIEEQILSSFYGGSKNARVQELIEEPHSAKDTTPPGRPLSCRLPIELVGDVVQIWEFLWRFYEVLGLGEPISFDQLEEELTDPWPIGSNFLEKFEKQIQEFRKLSSQPKEKAAGNSISSANGSDLSVCGESAPVFVQVETGSMKDAAQAKMASHTYNRCTGIALAKVHVSLLKIVVGELQSKVAVFADPSFDCGELKSRRGRKKDVDNSIPAKKSKLDILPLNELSWPELARRYILAVLSMDRNPDAPEISSRDGIKMFRCLHGDGGVLCGSLAGVSSMEADALLLAEADRQISDPRKRESEAWPMEDKDSDAVAPSDPDMMTNGHGVPEWAQLLEPVRKLPTNVGTRIRRCIYDSLEKDPPEWARKILEHSISKEVYKGNASGPTKKAVLSVLAKVSGGNLHSKPEKGRKVRHIEPKSDVIMKQCRVVLRRAAAADEDKVFCNLLGSSLSNPNDNDDEGILGFPGMVSRPLDFRMIDIRLAVGAYGGSHEAFLEDVREVWRNIYTAYGDRPDLMQLAEILSKDFETLYEKEVLRLVQKFVDDIGSGCSNDEVQRKMSDVHCSHEVPKAPWEEGVCKVCGIDKDDDSVLLCDTCDSEYHTYCLIPPLSKIPDGNWYCPSCVAVQCKNQESSSLSTQDIRRHERKPHLGEYNRRFLEALNQLAASMEQRELQLVYQVHELVSMGNSGNLIYLFGASFSKMRTFLLKFLCDEVLSSAQIREHLDQCVDMSNEVQQKIRSLAIEWRSLKFKEDLLMVRLSKESSGKASGASEALRNEGLATTFVNDGKVLGQEQIFSNRPGCHRTDQGGQVDIHKHLNEHFWKRISLEKHVNGNGTQIDNLNECSDPMDCGDEQISNGQIVKEKMVIENHSPMDSTNKDNESKGPEEQHTVSPQVQNTDDKMRRECVSLEHGEVRKGQSSIPKVNINSSNTKSALDAESNENLLPITESASGKTYVEENASTVSTGSAVPTAMEELITCNQDSSFSSFTIPSDVTESHACYVELDSLRNEISKLQESFAVLESQLLMSSLRRDFLGRDSSGRIYWAIGRPHKRPWLLVDGSMEVQLDKDSGDPIFGGSNDIFKNSTCSMFSHTSQLSGTEPKDDVWNSSPLVLYESDQEIHELVCSLMESDPRERELKECILQWQRLETYQARNHVNNIQSVSYACGSDKVVVPQLLTKAAILLESKYGPCLEPENGDIPKKRARKGKASFEERMYRCECLEPVWPSRHHCLSCHQTFCTGVELEEHNDGRCTRHVLTSEESKETNDLVKSKVVQLDDTTEKEGPNEANTFENSKNISVDMGSRSVNFQNKACPYDIKEISQKFITKDSNKDLVKEIGLIGLNGIPSFVSTKAPPFLDPSLMVGKLQGFNVDLISGLAGPGDMVVFRGTQCDLPVGSDLAVRVHKKSSNDGNSLESLKMTNTFECVKNRVNGSSRESGESMLEVNCICTVPQSSLRPLGGKVSQILKRLKVNLLDMDAALPVEALRPWKAFSKKRCAWRAFVKSSESIYAMVQASIMLEGMIKTDYLRNGWWYWSSLTAAAKTTTVSSLALRIYTLDASIMYMKTPSDPDVADSVKIVSRTGKKRKDMDGG